MRMRARLAEICRTTEREAHFKISFAPLTRCASCQFGRVPRHGFGAPVRPQDKRLDLETAAAQGRLLRRRHRRRKAHLYVRTATRTLFFRGFAFGGFPRPDPRETSYACR
jgi:hypothetical protein